jgi:coenzyme F420 hydrogenase subunit beta
MEGFRGSRSPGFEGKDGGQRTEKQMESPLISDELRSARKEIGKRIELARHQSGGVGGQKTEKADSSILHLTPRILDPSLISIVKLNFQNLYDSVIKVGLCTHCGTCAGSCPDRVIRMSDLQGQCLPELAGECSECGTCSAVCPGGSVDFDRLQPASLDFKDNPMLGRFREIYVAHATDGGIRRGGASGGMVTAFLLQLLEQGEIDGAVVLDFSKDRPWSPQVKLVSEKSAIVRAAQSKYSLYPQNTVIRAIRESRLKRVAYVGLPCQVHGLRKAMGKNIPGTGEIRHVIGIYCGNNLYYGATLSLFRRFGLNSLSRISSVAYREGEHPGHFVVAGKNGEKGVVDKFTFNYLSFFYTPMRCHFCVDQTNELADISIGDAWRGTYAEEDKQGRSVVIVRNPELLPLIKKGRHEGRYCMDSVSPETALQMHANVLDNKKVGAFARMDIWRRLRRETPEYSGDGNPVSLKRYCLEAANLALLSLCSRRISRDLVSRVPLGALGPMLKFIRGAWRKKAANAYARQRND